MQVGDEILIDLKDRDAKLPEALTVPLGEHLAGEDFIFWWNDHPYLFTWSLPNMRHTMKDASSLHYERGMPMLYGKARWRGALIERKR